MYRIKNVNSARLPTHATLIITNRCNLSCEYCYTRSNDRAYTELTTSEWKQAISRLASLPIFQIYIGGGEPFLRRDCIKLINFAHELNIVITTSTNGAFLSREIIEALPKSLHLQVSIHGLQPTHDHIKGSPNFEVAIRAARLLKCLGRHLCVGTVVSAINKEELVALYEDVIHEIQPDLWHVMRLQPVGRGHDNYNHLRLTNEEWASIVQWLRSIRLKQFPISIDSSYDLEGFENLDPRDAWFYWRDIGVDICVWPNGDLTPSDLLNEPHWHMGNILEQRDLADGIQHSVVLRRLWDAQNSVRGKCTRCKAFTACRGGSRAVALALTGNITEPDPFCPHNPPNRYAYE